MSRASAFLALALVAAAAGRGANELGTLFQRPRSARGSTACAAANPSADRGTDGPHDRPPQVTGYVQRSDGKNTIWLDGSRFPHDPRAAAAPRSARGAGRQPAVAAALDPRTSAPPKSVRREIARHARDSSRPRPRRR